MENRFGLPLKHFVQNFLWLYNDMLMQQIVDIPGEEEEEPVDFGCAFNWFVIVKTTGEGGAVSYNVMGTYSSQTAAQTAANAVLAPGVTTQIINGIQLRRLLSTTTIPVPQGLSTQLNYAFWLWCTDAPQPGPDDQ